MHLDELDQLWIKYSKWLVRLPSYRQIMSARLGGADVGFYCQMTLCRDGRGKGTGTSTIAVLFRARS